MICNFSQEPPQSTHFTKKLCMCLMCTCPSFLGLFIWRQIILKTHSLLNEVFENMLLGLLLLRLELDKSTGDPHSQPLVHLPFQFTMGINELWQVLNVLAVAASTDILAILALSNWPWFLANCSILRSLGHYLRLLLAFPQAESLQSQWRSRQKVAVV